MDRVAPSRRALWLGALAIFLVAGVASYGLSRIAEPMIPEDRYLNELAYYPSAEWLKPMSFGESILIADLTWLRAVQYYGEHRQLDNKFELLFHAFDVVTNFDPQHRNSYVFGGTSLAQEGKQFERGVKLLMKGRRANPDAWIYPFELGFLHYVEKQDYRTASLWFQEAARKPNRPEFVARFAAFSQEKSGNNEYAIELWVGVAQTTENPVLREKAVEEALELALGTEQEAKVRAWAEDFLGRVPPVGATP